MSDEPINQTQFVSDGPVESAAPEAVAGGDQASASKKVSPVILVILVGILLLLCVGVGMLLLRKPTAQVIATPTPTPVPEVIETSTIRTEIQPFFDQITTLNPESDDHPFPPVDFTVRMKDPTAK